MMGMPLACDDRAWIKRTRSPSIRVKLSRGIAALESPRSSKPESRHRVGDGRPDRGNARLA